MFPRLIVQSRKILTPSCAVASNYDACLCCHVSFRRLNDQSRCVHMRSSACCVTSAGRGLNNFFFNFVRFTHFDPNHDIRITSFALRPSPRSPSPRSLLLFCFIFLFLFFIFLYSTLVSHFFSNLYVRLLSPFDFDIDFFFCSSPASYSPSSGCLIK